MYAVWKYYDEKNLLALDKNLTFGEVKFRSGRSQAHTSQVRITGPPPGGGRTDPPPGGASDGVAGT